MLKNRSLVIYIVVPAAVVFRKKMQIEFRLLHQLIEVFFCFKVFPVLFIGSSGH